MRLFHCISEVKCFPDATVIAPSPKTWPLFDHKETQGLEYLPLGSFRLYFLFIPTLLRH